MTYTAIGIFQGDADWNVTVKISGFASMNEAEAYANDFRILLRDGRLYRNHADGTSIDEKPWIAVADEQVLLSRLKPEARKRIDSAHQKYRQKGLGHVAIAQQSIKEFDEIGNNDLVTTDDDYEQVDLPVSKWNREEGLTCGFGSLGCGAEKENFPV